MVDIPAAAAVRTRRLAGHACCRPFAGIVAGRALRDAVEGDADWGRAVAVRGSSHGTLCRCSFARHTGSAPPLAGRGTDADR